MKKLKQWFLNLFSKQHKLEKRIKELQDEVEYLNLELHGANRIRRHLAELTGNEDEPRWKWILLEFQHAIADRNKYKEMVMNGQTFGMESVGWRCFDGEGNYNYWDDPDSPAGNTMFDTEELFIKVKTKVPANDTQSDIRIMFLKDTKEPQIVSWNQQPAGSYDLYYKPVPPIPSIGEKNNG